MATQEPIINGTRGSALALKQSAMVAAALAPLPVTHKIITTTGDTLTHTPLYDIGGKALFCKEIDQALLAGTVDMAVHSLKDVPTNHPETLYLAAVLPRDDPRDVLLSHVPFQPENPNWQAVIGTSSLRRQAQIQHRFPKTRCQPLRGNITTRLQHWEDKQHDAIILAAAGLRRLSLLPDNAYVFPPEAMLPAACQGMIGIYCHKDNTRMRDTLAGIHHPPTMLAALAERAMLRRLDGSCRTPIGAYATLDGTRLTLRGCLATPDGATLFTTIQDGTLAEAEAIGDAAGRDLIQQAGRTYHQLVAG